MDQMSSGMSPTKDSGAWDAAGARRGSSTFDNIKGAVADKLHTAANTIHERAGQRGEQNRAIADYGHQAADWLDRSADYVREIDPQRIKADVENQVRRNPGRSLLIAGAAGLILGALLRRR